MNQEIWIEKYERIKKIGEGAYGEVYLCRHARLEGLRAVKQIRKDAVCSKEVIHEARVLQELSHPMIPIVYDVIEDETYMYIIMEYVDGITLYDLKQSSRVSTSFIIQSIIQLCELFDYLNSRKYPVLYIDLKPQNIMVSEHQLKLVDFGSAYYEEELKLQQKLSFTKKYASPEQISDGIINEKTCIYSIGKILEFLIKESEEKKSKNVFSQKSKYVFSLKNRSIFSRENIWFLSRNRKDKNIRKKLYAIQKRCTSYYPWNRYSKLSSIKLVLSRIMSKDSNIETYPIYPITVGVAGSQSRIGVTHLALFLASYYRKGGASCIYIEHNNSNDMLSIVKSNKKVTLKEHIFTLNQVDMSTYQRMESLPLYEYQIQIHDFSTLSEDKIEAYETMDIKLAVVGAKPWEQLQTLELKGRLQRLTNVKYIYNFCSMSYFHQIEEKKGKEKIYRLPIFYSPFTWVENEVIDEFGREITYDIMQERMKNLCD